MRERRGLSAFTLDVNPRFLPADPVVGHTLARDQRATFGRESL